jgi:penicillin-insensitive murein endopeptidase
LFFIFSFCLSSSAYSEGKSICYGTTSKGSLKRGVKLPSSGANFESYSFLAGIAGRTYVHSEVQKILLKTYKALEKKYPNKVYKYAETGFEEGGKFKPHKTHQNGLSVDHMVPVLKNGKSVHLPTNVFNKLGYSIEFDLKGRYKDYQLDYESLGALIVEVHKQTRKLGYKLWRVIFDPKMTPNLLKTFHGKYLKQNIYFTKKRSWVRHDEHIHIDFKIPCK